MISQQNFAQTLPTELQEQAILAVKDDYAFGFLELGDKHSEYQLEQAIINNIRLFLIEMGGDFCFIGSQFVLDLNDKEYKIDLLLFHRRLQSLVAIDLKIGEFEPEHKGKMEFYLSVLNDTVKLPHENPAVGIIICKSKNRTVVEYSLKTAMLPIGVATYNTTEELPDTHKDLLHATKEITQKLLEWYQGIDS